MCVHKPHTSVSLPHQHDGPSTMLWKSNPIGGVLKPMVCYKWKVGVRLCPVILEVRCPEWLWWALSVNRLRRVKWITTTEVACIVSQSPPRYSVEIHIEGTPGEPYQPCSGSPYAHLADSMALALHLYGGAAISSPFTKDACGGVPGASKIRIKDTTWILHATQ